MTILRDERATEINLVIYYFISSSYMKKSEIILGANS